MKRLTKVYKYKWTRKYKVDPQVAGEIFQRCKDDGEVLSLAADPSHPMHNDFEWDDTVAAEAHRLYQTRAMRCSLQVEVINKQNEPTHIRAFVRTLDKVGYVPVLEASIDELQGAEQTCWLEMKKFRARWKGLQFAREVVEAIAEKERRVSRSPRKKYG
jgi:hypothetical protein